MNSDPILFVEKSQRKRTFNWVLAAFLISIIVVGLGAFTRLVHAGLGCPDWPGCYGHLWAPKTVEEVAAAEAKFGETVQHDKTWPEMVHRYFAGTLGLFILWIAISAIRLRSTVNQPLKLPIALLCLVTLQAAFGMWTVTLDLWPQVVTAHLLGGFTTMTLIWLLLQRLGGVRWRLLPKQVLKLGNLRFWVWLLLIVVLVQIILGGWMSANYAATACATFPSCNGSWWPAMNFVEGFDFFQDIGPNYLGGQLHIEARTAIHYSHRIGAVAVVLVSLVVAIKMLATGVAQLKTWLAIIGAILLLQIILGITNIVADLPLAVAVAHNGVGALLLISVVTLLYRLYTITIKTDAHE